MITKLFTVLILQVSEMLHTSAFTDLHFTIFFLHF